MLYKKQNIFKIYSKWELALCRTCGSQGIHMSCGQLKWANPVWECEECTSILSKHIVREKYILIMTFVLCIFFYKGNDRVKLGNSSAIGRYASCLFVNLTNGRKFLKWLS